MFYNKKYVISDYLNYTELNELIDKEKELINEMSIKKIKNDEYVYVNGGQEEAGSNYSLLGDTQQASTPTPTSPVEVQTVTGRQDVKICQKNLIDLSQTIIGKAWNNSDNSARAVCYVRVQPNTAYTISMDNLTGFDAVGLVEKTNISDTTALSGVMSFTGERTITTTATTQYLGMQFAKTSITLEDITSHQIMVEKGSSKTTYEAYNGNTYEINLGKNLIDTSKFVNKNNTNITQISTGVRATFVGSQGTYRWAYYKIPNSTDFFGKTCTITANIYNSASNKGSIRVWQLDSNNNAIGNQIGTALNSSGSVTITFPSSFSSGAVSFGLLFYSNVDGTLTNGDYVDYTNLQFEIGSFSTSYSTYFTPIELCKISNYQDKIIKNNGKWYLYKAIGKYSYNSDLTLNAQDTNTMQFLTPVLNVGAGLNSTTFSSISLCNLMGTSVSNYTGLNGTTSAKRIRVNIAKSIAPTQADATTLFSNNNLTIYYVSNLPTATEITDTTLLSQLESAWKSIKYWNYMEILPAENYDLDLPVYSLNDFLFLEDIDKIEKNVMQIGYDFFQPSGYIQNKIWIKNATILGYENTSNNFGAEDLNRIITDINILYEHKDDTPTIYNLFANENWDEESLLEWE